jgi:hypothetical protein
MGKARLGPPRKGPSSKQCAPFFGSAICRNLLSRREFEFSTYPVGVVERKAPLFELAINGLTAVS